MTLGDGTTSATEGEHAIIKRSEGSGGWNLNANSQMMTAVLKDVDLNRRRQADRERSRHKLLCSVSTYDESGSADMKKEVDIDRLIYPYPLNFYPSRSRCGKTTQFSCELSRLKLYRSWDDACSNGPGIDGADMEDVKAALRSVRTADFSDTDQGINISDDDHDDSNAISSPSSRPYYSQYLFYNAERAREHANIVGRAKTKEEFEWAMSKATEMYDYIQEEFQRKFSHQSNQSARGAPVRDPRYRPRRGGPSKRFIHGYQRNKKLNREHNNSSSDQDDNPNQRSSHHLHIISCFNLCHNRHLRLGNP
eukprot:g78256.t1